jgi:hypothetical protein
VRSRGPRGGQGGGIAIAAEHFPSLPLPWGGAGAGPNLTEALYSQVAGRWRRALHVCRGHFARYTEERPLFGRVAGTFWRPMHLRGSASEGLVLKDDTVLSPDTSPG